MRIERKFTPGVWSIRSRNMFSLYDIVSENNGINDVARVWYDPSKITHEEHKANAKAIAAIPQMVDALEAMYTTLESEGKLNTILGHQIINTIKLLD